MECQLIEEAISARGSGFFAGVQSDLRRPGGDETRETSADGPDVRAILVRVRVRQALWFDMRLQEFSVDKSCIFPTYYTYLVGQ